MGRGGLVRTAATTAVVAGTATAVSGHMRGKQAEKAQEAAEAQAYRDQQAAAAAPPPPAAGGDDLVSKLNELAQLKAQGVLSEAEFEAAKAKLLG
jgi:Short C-terminal domain